MSSRKSGRSRKSQEIQLVQAQWQAGMKSMIFGGESAKKEAIHILLLLDQNDRVILNRTLPKIEDSDWTGFLSDGFRNPLIGMPRKPAVLKINNLSLSGETQKLFPEIRIITEETPEIDEICNHLFADIQSRYKESLKYSDFLLGNFFAAAREFYLHNPWEHLNDNKIIRIDSPEEFLDLHGAALYLIDEESYGSFGFIFLNSEEKFDKLLDVFADSEDIDLKKPEYITVAFVPEDRLPNQLRAEVKKNQWSVPNDKAYPVPTSHSAGGSYRPSDEEMIQLTEIMRAFCGFYEKNQDSFSKEDDENEAIRFTSKTDEQTIIFTYPYHKYYQFQLLDEIENLRLSLQEEPENTDLRIALAYNLIEMGTHSFYTEAMNLAKEVESLDPENPELFAFYGDMVADAEDYRKAAEFYLIAVDFSKKRGLEELAERFSGDAKSSMLTYAFSLFMAGNYRSAETEVLNLLSDFGKDADALEILGRIYLHRLEPMKASDYFKEALESAEDSEEEFIAVIRCFLGICCGLLKNYNEALEMFRSISALEREDEKNFTGFQIITLLDIGKTEEAQVLLNQFPDDFTDYLICRMRNETKKGSESLTRAVDANPFIAGFLCDCMGGLKISGYQSLPGFLPDYTTEKKYFLKYSENYRKKCADPIESFGFEKSLLLAMYSLPLWLSIKGAMEELTDIFKGRFNHPG